MKIVGIVLLALLGLVLLLLVLALFVPFTYRIAGSCHDKKLRLDGHVFVFAGLLGAGGAFKEGEPEIFLRILGIKKRLGGQKTKEEAREAAGEKKESAASLEPQKVSPHKESPQKPENREDAAARVASDEAAATQEPGRSPKTATVEKARTAFRHFADTVRSLRQNVHRIREAIADEGNQQALGFLLGRAAELLRSLKPRSIRLSLAFSTGSPDTTGQVLGVLALFPFTYRNGWRIMPDFTAEEFFVETDFDIRGHIFGIQLLRIALRILLDKNCQKLYHKMS